MMKTIIGTFCGLLAVLIVCGAKANTAANNSYCVSNYKEFEKKTFTNNSHNQHLLYEAFYPPNGHLPYSVKLSYLTVLPNGRVVNISIRDRVCTIVQWRWIASPVFLSFEPHILNILAFYTLNYFRDWTTPSITLRVPYPCPNVTLHYLTLMTSLIQDYALEKLSGGTPSGDVVGHCLGKERYKHVPVDGVSHFGSLVVASVVIILGGIIATILVFVSSVMTLKRYWEDWIKLSYLYSYSHYGFWWGLVCFGSILLTTMFYLELSVFKVITPAVYTGESFNILIYIIFVIVMLMNILLGIPIAIYFVYKTKQPPAIPYILMIPVIVLFCCCNTKRAKLLVFGMALWIILTALPFLMVHGLLTVMAGFAEPFAVVTNALVLVLFAFCLTNIFALLFTISAYLFTPKHRRPQRRGSMIRAMVLILLLVTVTCFCTAIGLGSYMVNTDTRQVDIRSLIGSAVLPVVLGLTTFALKKLITKCQDTRTIQTVDNEEDVDMLLLDQ